MSNELDLSKTTIFLFRCPICGSEPGEQRLTEFLSKWDRTDPRRLMLLLGLLYAATWEIRFGESRWLTKKFQSQADNLIRTIFNNKKEAASPPIAFISRIDTEQLQCSVSCPVCQCNSGSRKADNYFTTWNMACRVQTSNLYFETGLIIQGLLATPAKWLSEDMFDYFTKIQTASTSAAKSTGLPSCQRCGRPTTALFGATKEHPELGRCRWCLNTETFSYGFNQN